MPFLSRVRLPQDAASAAASLQKSGDPYVQQAIAYAFARSGDVQQSLIALAQLERMLDLKEQYGWQLEMKQRSEALRMELQDSPLAVQSRLGSWEAETAKKLWPGWDISFLSEFRNLRAFEIADFTIESVAPIHE